MDLSFILSAVLAAGSALLFLPKMMLSANDRVTAEKKALDDRFNQVWHRLDAGEKDMLLVKAMIDSNQLAMSHRLEMQEQKIALTLQTILEKVDSMERWLGGSRPPFQNRHE